MATDHHIPWRRLLFAVVLSIALISAPILLYRETQNIIFFVLGVPVSLLGVLLALTTLIGAARNLLAARQLRG
jgi:ABC-type multidrug transport system permease subunit